MYATLQKDIRKRISDEMLFEQRLGRSGERSQAVIWKTSLDRENSEKSRTLRVVPRWGMWAALGRRLDLW